MVDVNSDFGATQGQYSVPGSQGVPGTSPPAGSYGYSSSDSSISPSQAEALIAALMFGYPFLPPPNDIQQGNTNVASVSISPTQLAMMVNQKEHDIISSMWDTYINQIRAFAEQSRKDDIKKWTIDADKGGLMSGAQYHAYLMSISSTSRADEVEGNGNAIAVSFNNMINSWSVPPVTSADSTQVNSLTSNTSNYGASFIAACMACSPDLVLSQLGLNSQGPQISVSPAADALTAVGPTSGLPADSQAAVAMMAALLFNGVANRTAVEAAPDANSKKTPQQMDLDYAIQFANNALALVTQNAKGSANANPEQQAQNRPVRLMLSLVSLNMLLRTGYGGMNGEEFKSLLAGNFGNIDPSILPQVRSLVALINQDLPADDLNSQATINNMAVFVDEKNDYSAKSADSLLDFGRTLRGYLQATNQAAANATINTIA